MLDEDSITAEYSFVNMFLSFYDKNIYDDHKIITRI